jgi:hypothetical protein
VAAVSGGGITEAKVEGMSTDGGMEGIGVNVGI